MEEIVSTPAMTALANEISDAISTAMQRGLEPDHALGVVAAVLADYGRGCYGDAYLNDIAVMILARARFDLPQDIGVQ